MHPEINAAIVSEYEKKQNEDNTQNEIQNRDLSVKEASLNFFIKERIPLAKLNSIYLRNFVDGMSRNSIFISLICVRSS